ncbi:MAG: Zn-ribbon domain-containing OB-fold protein [Patescibacteria group bacterium]
MGGENYSRYLRLSPQKDLRGVECTDCETRYFPPRPLCPGCGSRLMKPWEPGRWGEVYSYSVAHEALAGYGGQAPYPIALVRLDDGPMLTAQLTGVDPEDIQIGMRVEMVTRRIKEDGDRGLINYGYKFRPSVRR